MLRNLRLILPALVAVFCAGVLTTTAAAKPAPRSFYGVAPQSWLAPADYARMHAGHVGSLRILMSWC